MPMLAQVRLNNVNNIPADGCINTWAIAGPTPADSSDINQVVGMIADFYNEPFATVPLDAYLSQSLSRVLNAHSVSLYDLTGHLAEGDDHGSPFAVSPFTLLEPGGTPLPHEVSVCLTLEAEGRDTAAVQIPDPTPEPRDEFDTRLALFDRPKTRRTGRVFIGPLGTTSISQVASQPRPETAFTTLLRNLAIRLDTGLKSINPVEGEIGLGVWSRRDAAVRFLEAVSTDDAFDTQRRRGVAPTARARTLVA